jgi:hypothetical protein
MMEFETTPQSPPWKGGEDISPSLFCKQMAGTNLLRPPRLTGKSLSRETAEGAP